MGRYEERAAQGKAAAAGEAVREMAQGAGGSVARLPGCGGVMGRPLEKAELLQGNVSRETFSSYQRKRAGRTRDALRLS